MAIQDDLNTVATARDSNAAIVKWVIKASAAYIAIDEALAAMNEAQAEIDLPSCPDSIKTHGQGVLAKLNVAKAALDSEHADFLTWEPPAVTYKY